MEIINSINEFSVLPVCFTFYGPDNILSRLGIEGYIHKAIETRFANIDKEIQAKTKYFRQNISEDNNHSLIKDFKTNPPRGYSFNFDIDNTENLLFIYLNLFGNYADAINYFDASKLDSMFSDVHVKTIKFVEAYLYRIENIDGDFYENIVSSINIKQFKKFSLNSDFLKIDFNSPVSLFNQHSKYGNLDFGQLIYNLYKRIWRLSFIYGNGPDQNLEELQAYCKDLKFSVDVSSINLS